MSSRFFPLIGSFSLLWALFNDGATLHPLRTSWFSGFKSGSPQSIIPKIGFASLKNATEILLLNVSFNFCVVSHFVTQRTWCNVILFSKCCDFIRFRFRMLTFDLTSECCNRGPNHTARNLIVIASGSVKVKEWIGRDYAKDQLYKF